MSSSERQAKASEINILYPVPAKWGAHTSTSLLPRRLRFGQADRCWLDSALSYLTLRLLLVTIRQRKPVVQFSIFGAKSLLSEFIVPAAFGGTADFDWMFTPGLFVLAIIASVLGMEPISQARLRQ